ncbi:unnamed protein product [Schistosoma margrebowiei]|uniref:Saposin B-type domain-containing protein n=1 Tax=Schistosoma margrebowiei TaxID=48269 RepID=A0AA85A740_9TREM|nr:unnamed protein product [Schistosoma margrebowiei]
MKLSTTDCFIVFCVIHLIVTDPINAGSSQENRLPWNLCCFCQCYFCFQQISDVKLVVKSSDVAMVVSNHCLGYTGETFIKTFYHTHHGTYNDAQIRTIANLINSTCNKFKKYGTTTASSNKG